MNTIHNNGENDNSLDAGLDKLNQAYGRLQHEEPPELLDQSILNSAHRAVEAKPHWMQFGWLHGLTTAAVFVLALSLIFNTREPVPDYENGVRLNETSGLKREKAAQKQSPDVKPDDLRMEMKKKNEDRQDVFQSAPVSSSPPGEAMKMAVDDQAAEPVAGAQRSMVVKEGQQAKTDSVDKDASVNEPVLEEALFDETDLVVKTPEPGITSKISSPAAAAITTVSESEVSADTDPEIENLIMKIISLKQSGDESWISELELFRQDHPDYPIPEELLH